MSETTKLFTLFGTHIGRHYGSRYYGKAMNQTRLLAAAYDQALDECDLLMMPIKATELPPADAQRESLYRACAQHDLQHGAVRHHPPSGGAVPCGMSDGLPVSLMLVGKRFDEPTIYKAAFAYEQAGDWKKM